MSMYLTVDRSINQSTLKRINSSPEPTGFVPKPDPVARLADDSGFGPYEAVADELPHLLQSGRLRPTIDAMNGSTDPAELEALVHALPDDGARRRALLLLAGLANAYVWGGGPDVTPRDRIPACTCRAACILGWHC